MDNTLKNLVVLSMYEIIKEVQESPDEATVNEFNTRYAGATFATWIHVEHGIWRVDFSWKKKEHYALFDAEGNWLEARNVVLWDFLPKEIKKHFGDHYMRNGIERIYHIETPRMEFYELICRDAGHESQFLYDSAGTLLGNKTLI